MPPLSQRARSLPTLVLNPSIRDIDASLTDNTLIFPDEATLAKVKIFDAEAADNTAYKEQFQAVIGA